MEPNSQMLRISSAMPDEIKALAVKAAMLQGFLTLSASFPIVSVGESDNVRQVWEQTRAHASRQLRQRPFPADYQSTLPEARPIPDFDFRKERGVEDLFSIGAFLKDQDGDLLPDAVDFKICLPERCSAYMTAAACTLAFRVGMEVTAYEGEILGAASAPGNKIIFQDAETCRMDLEQREDDLVLTVRGRGKDLLAFMNLFCERFPCAGRQRTWADVLQDMTEDFALRGVNGQLACGAALENTAGAPAEVFGSGDLSPETARALKRLHPGIQFINGRAKKKIYEHSYAPEWEVNDLLKILDRRVYPQIRPGDRVRILGALSEDRHVREALEDRIRNKLTQAGGTAEECILLCAYKQGFSWIEEQLLPEAERRRAEKVVIRVRPFLPPGETEWRDEDGATPSYVNLGADDPEHWYDLPIRYLQELYPVEDVIAKRLHIQREDITLEIYRGAEDLTYEWEAFSGGVSVQRDSYRARCAERPYLDRYPGMGKVHPPTGYVKVWINGNPAVDERIATDTERIWDLYQQEVLPACEAYVEKKTCGAPSPEAQPFFTQLRLDVQLSEPDERLESREDLLSSLDALHEDLYFAGTDYFKNLGIHTCGKVFDAPGLILPVIRKRDGPPSLCVTLYEPVCPVPCVRREGAELQRQRPREEICCLIDRISYANGNLVPRILVKGVLPELVEAYARLWNEGLLAFPPDAVMDCPVWYDGTAEWPGRPRLKVSMSAIDIGSIDLMEQQVIGYDQYLQIMEQLERVDGLSVYQTAVSYQGRKIYAVELAPRTKGYCSRTKRLTMRPSEIINCRHHANEVSSTNAAFLLIRELLTNPSYRDLPEKLNLVIIPMENVDGAAIHYELQKENPRWKFHVARFNSVGKEFYYDHFLPDTIHTEARSFRRLWRAFLPDVVVDDHGVPSHEWEQPFSGYTSPSYKGFWLPRSLLYGYYWTVKGDAFRSSLGLNKQLEDTVADAVEQDEEMCRWNREWMREFETYAHRWMPRLFPADYYRGMIDYWIPFDYHPEHRYPSIRFPWITSAAYTSEVADETAQGSYLGLCARAHTVHDLAMIRALADARCVWKTCCETKEKTVRVSMVRQRPIIIDYPKKRQEEKLWSI